MKSYEKICFMRTSDNGEHPVHIPTHDLYNKLAQI